MSNFNYDDDIILEAAEEIEEVAEEVTEETIVEEVKEDLPVVEEIVEEEPKSKKKTKKEDYVESKSSNDEKVVLFSTRAMLWEGFGYINRGYNVVTKDEASRWITRNYVRLATPEETLKELNK